MERYLKVNRIIEIKGIEGHYTVKDIIGRGSSCVVYLADFANINGEKSEHFLKEFNPKNINLIRDDKGNLRVENQRDLMDFENAKEHFIEGYQKQQKLRLETELKNYTANIQNTYHDHGTVYIDMTVNAGQSYENVEEKSIYDLVRRIRVLARVIGVYHRLGYLHLDIKPSNIFVRPEDETCEDVLLFDCDSLIEENTVNNGVDLSYTPEWAPIELNLRNRGYAISKATDIFYIGEILFVKLMGRHSKPWERRSYSKYDFDLSLPIFKNVIPKSIPLLNELLCHTICNNPSDRYQTTEKLIEIIDKIIGIFNPEEPFFIKKILSDCIDTFIKFDRGIITGELEKTRCDDISEYWETMDDKIKRTITDCFGSNNDVVQKYKSDYDNIFNIISNGITQEIDNENICRTVLEIISITRSEFADKINYLISLDEVKLINVNVQKEEPEKVKVLDLDKQRKTTLWKKFLGPSLENYYVIPLKCKIDLLKQIDLILKHNEERIHREYLIAINNMFEKLRAVLKNVHIEKNEQGLSLYQKAMYLLYSNNKNLREEGLKLLFLDYEESHSEKTVNEINKQLPLFNGNILEYIDYKILFVRKKNDYDTGGQLLFGTKGLDGTEHIIFDLHTIYATVSFKTIKGHNRVYILIEDDAQIFLYVYVPEDDKILILDSQNIPSILGELTLNFAEEKVVIYGKCSYIDSSENRIFKLNI